jgi:hypothetical protein
MKLETVEGNPIYHGDLKMPKGFEINAKSLTKDILTSYSNKGIIPFSKELDKINNYIIEHFNLRFNKQLENREIWANTFFFPYKTKYLKNNHTFTCLYIPHCKNLNLNLLLNKKDFCISLKNNQFIIFESKNDYYFESDNKEFFNFVLNITYEFV